VLFCQYPSEKGTGTDGKSMNIKAIGGSNDVSDVFDLYDLRVKVVASEKPMVCDHQVGEYFDVIGEMIVFPEGGRNSFTLYPLAAILPLLPAKQRITNKNDWMTTDAVIACPDPHCGGRFHIARIATRSFSHAETTVVPLPGDSDETNESVLTDAHSTTD